MSQDVEVLRKALQTIIGSNGDRDYMRAIARVALATRPTPPQAASAAPEREELLGEAIGALIRGDIKCSDDLPPEKRPVHISARRAFGAVYNLLLATHPTSPAQQAAIAVEPLKRWLAVGTGASQPPAGEAASDLLRVAELVVDWLDEEPGTHKLCDVARAAIAKHKGQFVAVDAQPSAEPEAMAVLRKDAERYRWLREGGWKDSALYATGPMAWGTAGIALLSGDELDCTIDAALVDAPAVRRQAVKGLR